VRPPEDWRKARATLAFAAATAIAFLLSPVLGGDRVALLAGFIPAHVGGEGGAAGALPAFLTPLTATLVHDGPLHLVFNLLILVFCGRAVEAIVGARGIVILYLVGAYAAAAAHWAAGPAETAPMVGASGAISAVLGAYAILFGRNRVRVAHPIAAQILHALWLAAAWVGMQILVGLSFEGEGARIAVWAHIGGFLAGLLLARPLLLLRWRGA
jgi:membrane associated rhomboid family serine protease